MITIYLLLETYSKWLSMLLYEDIKWKFANMKNLSIFQESV